MLPVIIPVTAPVVGDTVATVVGVQLQVPPDPEVNVVVLPWHMLNVPEMAGGAGFTVTNCDVAQPVESV